MKDEKKEHIEEPIALEQEQPEIQPKKKFRWVIPVIVGLAIVLIGLGAYIFAQKLQQGKKLPMVVSHVTSTITPAPLGEITWNPKVEEIAEDATFATIQTILEHSDVLNLSDETKPRLVSKHFYHVGTWTSGTYKSNNIIDAVYEIQAISGFDGEEYTSQEIVRFTKHNNKLIIFDFFPNYPSNNSFPTPTSVIDSTIRLPGLLSSTNLTITGPGGVYKGDVPFPVVYQGQTNNLTFEPAAMRGNFLTAVKPGYTFFATFYKGQKFYGKIQDKQIPWEKLEGYPYYGEELDHTEIKIKEPDQFPNYGDTNGITWINPPDLMTEYKDYVNTWYTENLKKPADIKYTTSFSIGCTRISMNDLAGNTMFDSSQIQQVGTMDGYTIYLPTNANTMTQHMYDRIKKNTPTMEVSYEQYLKSYPLLVVKDIFGEYQVVFREDYPGRGGGCGKPVIYLYPQEKTHITVSFASPMQLTSTIPQYHNGWRVIAYPDGTLIDSLDSKHYPYLYWEGFTQKTLPQLEYGTVVKKDDVQTFLSKTLYAFGLNKQESTDFIDYWLPYVSTKPYYVISFYTTKELDAAIPETISPKPESVLRILMYYRGLDKPISVVQPPPPIPFHRNGFTVVEWGGIYAD